MIYSKCTRFLPVAHSSNNIFESIERLTGSRSNFISVSLEGRDIDSYGGKKKRKGGKNEKRDEIELLRGDKREAGAEDEQKRMGKCEEE